MPKEFNDCRAGGGRMRTQSLGDAFYRVICYDSKGSHPGHKHRKKAATRRREER